ncbi:MAG TPA: hypothetical protein VJ694_03435, partial [Patescibacteria group bacterium]|nr:hypothetical protein [Patescibacteria group bacterium]
MRGRSLFRRKTPLALLLAAFLATGVFGVGIPAPQIASAQTVSPDLDDATNNVSAPTTASAASAGATAAGTTAAEATKKSAWDVIRISLTNTAAVAVLNG